MTKNPKRRLYMSWKYFLMLLAVTMNLLATPEQEMFYFNSNPSTREEQRPLFISLGGTCHVAIALRALELRDAAYPLDWIISTNHAAFLHVLGDKFVNYADPNYFNTYQGVPKGINWYYNLSFPHDFTAITEDFTKETALKEWDSFKERYDRRVERFQELANFQGKVYFFRCMWSSDHEGANGLFQENSLRARQIKDTIAAIFPNLDFTLVIITHPDLGIPKLEEIPNVVEFRIGRTHAEFYEKIMLLAFGAMTSYAEPKFIPIKRSPIKEFFFERREKTLYFCVMFSKRSKNAVMLLEKAGLKVRKNRKGRGSGIFEAKDPKVQLQLLKFARTLGAIPSEIYPELLHKIKQG